MNVSVILAHPDPRSFNHAIAETVVRQLESNGHSISFHDLYGENFDPLLPAEEISKNISLPDTLRAHCKEISEAEGIIIVHPNWWGQPPAILKGWIDRVFRPGVAYDFLKGDSGEAILKGLLKARAALVLNTSNTTPERELNVFGDPLEAIWRNCVIDQCGVSNFHRRVFSVIVTSTEAQRKAWLDEARRTFDEVFPKENT